jgi:hypothetical protein
MKNKIYFALNLSAFWLMLLSLVQFGTGFVLCCGGNVGALIYGLAYAFASMLSATLLAKLAEWAEFGF